MSSAHFKVARRGSPILPLSISGTPVTTATQGAAYTGFTVTASGGQPPYSFSNPSPLLPTGIAVNATSGLGGGLPTGTGVSSGIDIRVTDALGRTADLTPFSITVSAAGGGLTIAGDANGEAAYSAFKPILFDKLVLRNLQVATNAEQIVLHEELCHAFGPQVVSWNVSGPNATNFAAGPTAGTMVVASGVRGSLAAGDYPVVVTATNANGSSSSATLTVRIVANAKAYFVSYGSGSDSNNGLTPATAWKFMPGTSDYTGSAKTFTTGDVVFMKAEVHRTSHTADDAAISALAHAGSSGAPMFVEMDGWGGRAILSGDKVISGWVSVTQAEVNGNPNYLNIKKLDLTSQGGAAELYQWIFDGESILYPANYPTPASLDNFETVDFVNAAGSERYGLANIPCQTSGGTRRMYTDGTPSYLGGPPNTPGTTVTIVDPALATKFGNVAASTLPPFNLWIGGNHIGRYPVTTYNFATSTITIACLQGLSINTNVTPFTTAYSFSFWPGQITQAGQFGLSTDGLTVYAWLPNNQTTSISRLRNAVRWGLGGYVTYNGGQYQRYSGGTSRLGAPLAGGHAFYWYGGGGAVLNQAHIDGAWIRHMHSDDRDGVIHGVGGMTNIIADCNVYRTKTWENPSTSGARFGVQFNGLTGGSAAAIRAYPYGRFRGNFTKPNGLGGTICLLQGADGVHYIENCARNQTTMHGNGFSTYDSTVLCQNIVVELNYWENCIRSYTTNTNGPNRNILITGNFMLNVQPPDLLYTFSPFGGEPGGIVTRNLIMAFDSTNTYDVAANFYTGCGDVSNNVIGGCAALTAWTGDFNNNLVTMNRSIPISTAGGTQTGNTVLVAPNEIKYWNGTFTTAMQAALGPGRIGPFHTI